MRLAAEVRRTNTGLNRLTSVAAASLLSVFALQPAAHAEVVNLDPCFACALNTTPPAGDEWVIQGSFVHVGVDGLISQGALTNNASYFSNGTNFISRGALTNNKTFINSGSFQALGAAINNNGTLINTGALVATTQFNNLAGRVINSGTIDSYATISNKAVLSNTGTISMRPGAGINNELGGTFTNGGTLTVFQSSIVNRGTFRNQPGGLIRTSGLFNYGTLTNEAGSTLDSGYAFFNYSGSRLVNHGTIITSDSHFELAAGSNYDFTGGKLVVSNTLGRMYLNRDFIFGEARAGTVEVGYGGSVTNGANMQVAKGYSQTIAGRINNLETGTITVNANATLITGDAVNNKGKITNLGTIKLGEALLGGNLVNTGTVEIGGTYVAGGISGTGKLVQNEGHSVLSGPITVGSAAFNGGQVTMQASMNASKLTVGAQATVQQTSGATLTAQNGVTVNGSYEFTDAGGTISGPVTNNGIVRVAADSKAVFNGRFGNQAKLITEGGSSSQFSDLVVGADGVIQAGVDTFTVTGGFLNSSLKGADWKTGDAKLILQGAGAHKLSLAGADLGASLSGYTNNFAWGSLTLGAGGTYALSDGNGVTGGALYVGQLTLDGGLAQLGTINSAFNIYYNIRAAGNEYLGGQTYAFGSGGGKLIGVGESLNKAKLSAAAVVPEPSTWALAVGGLMVTLWRRKARRPAQ